jgi:ribose transport system permease protein
MGLVIAIAALFVIMGIFAEGFLSWYNIHNVLKDFSILLIVSSGMTLAILLGKIDMSMGSVMSLSAITITLLLRSGVSFPLAVSAGIGAGALVGLLNGYLVGVQKLNHFIATFATMSIAKGVALIACNGDIINSNSMSLLFVGTGKLLGLFVIVWITAAVFIALYLMMRKGRFGYQIYSVGGSENAAMLSGINTSNVYIRAFIIGGILAATAGLFMAGKANSGNATMGDGYEFNAIAIVLIGGTPFDGGKGGLLGTMFGALFIAVLRNGISLLGFTPAWQYAIIGITILVVIILDVALNERRKTEERRRVGV